MKPAIHPQFYITAKVTCACGNVFTTGSILPELQTEICSNCHPFYTGKQKLVDTAGRVDKYKQRMAAATAKKATATTKKPRKTREAK
jgi:large subunit ribosomal protein L31